MKRESEAVAAEIIAILAHYGQTTQSEGMAYINHPAAVASSVAVEYKAIAWLHDVLEDSSFTEGHLLAAGIEPATIQAVTVITRRDGERYVEFIDRIAASGNIAAITVKLADLRHNLRPGCPEDLAKRYRLAIPRLEAALALLITG